MSLDMQRLDSLMRLVVTERIAELDVVEDGFRVHIARRANNVATGSDSRELPGRSTPAVPSSTPCLDRNAAVAIDDAAHTVTAPMSGVFCRAHSAGGAPLCSPGDTVAIGAPLAVVEAMKIINEIVADVAGTVAQVLCPDGQTVEPGQALFIINQD